MCGFAGYVGVERRDWVPKAALVALRHRGPDDEGTLDVRSSCGNFVASLVHTRLSILDLSPAGKQPMASPSGHSWIVYNGEVYNFREIRRELEGEAVRFRSATDTEVVAAALERWGVAALDRFRGMFAFAVLTPFGAEEGPGYRVFLVRDRFGVKPLYYFADDRGIAFASEVRALLASGAVPRSVDAVGLAGCLLYGSVQEPSTLVSGVRSLEPGTWMEVEVSPRGVRTGVGRYWDLLSASLAASVNGVRPLLEEAVALRLVADVPIGAFLSGGLDSSAIVALASRSRPIDTFSVVFEEKAFDESAYSAAVARRWGTHHHAIAVQSSEVLARMDEALAAEDQPTQDGVNTYFVARAVAEQGIKVALSGVGGDEVFCGYPTFRLAPLIAKLRRVKGGLFPRLAGSLLARLTSGAPEREAKLTLALDPSGPDPCFVMRMVFLPEEARGLLRDDLQPAVEEFLEGDMIQPKIAALDPVNRCSYLELTRYMRNTLLRDTDFMGMAHGLEIRTPLLDHRLVEAVFALPGKMKLNGRKPKPILAEAVRDLLPAKVARRAKRGFTLPFETWLRGELRSAVEGKLIGENRVCGGLLDPKAATRVWRGFLQGRVSWSRVWTLYALDRWIVRNLTV